MEKQKQRKGLEKHARIVVEKLKNLTCACWFPSMSAKRTGEIIRRRRMRSKMKVEGFDWRKGLVYIQMNHHLTGNLRNMWKILPYRSKVGGTAPGMGSKSMSGKSGKIEKQWCFKTKEESGEKVLDILHSSNPWKGEDCGRECMLCVTKAMTEKNMKQDCRKRSLVYETCCETCLRKDIKEVEEQEGLEEKEREDRIRKIKKHKYVGETARSAHERGMEHQDGLNKMDENNHMMTHVKLEEVKFGMKVVRHTHSAMERKVLESAVIQEEEDRKEKRRKEHERDEQIEKDYDKKTQFEEKQEIKKKKQK